jgi:hypothetical protein
VAQRAARKVVARRAVVKMDTPEGLGQHTKTLRSRFVGSNQALFIGQSTRSNYCGVYSTGMLLSLLGITTTRNEALALFGLKRSNPNFAGADHEDIGNIFAEAAKVRQWFWEYHKRFDFISVSTSLLKYRQLKNQPTLFSFGAVHKNGEWHCTHVAVIVYITNEVIALLDPLGKKPDTVKANTWLRASAGSKSVQVLGSSYSVDIKKEVAVLQWNR